MTARKIGLLLLILGAGAAFETAWAVRNHVDIGPQGCRVLGGRFYGPSFSFEDTVRADAPAGARVEVTNAFGRVQVTTGEPGEVKLTLRKVVYRPTEEQAREYGITGVPFFVLDSRFGVSGAQPADAMLAALPGALPPDSAWSRPEGGMFLWVRLPETYDTTALLPAVVEQNVAYVPGAPFYAGEPDRSTLRLCFVTQTPQEIAEGLRRLGRGLLRG